METSLFNYRERVAQQNTSGAVKKPLPLSTNSPYSTVLKSNKKSSVLAPQHTAFQNRHPFQRSVLHKEVNFMLVHFQKKYYVPKHAKCPMPVKSTLCLSRCEKS